MRFVRRALPFIGPALLFAAGAVLLGDWIVDDAGISFAYAKHIAQAEGFVSQPGRAPVEGASNFLWVLLLVPFFVLRLFDPVMTPKLLGAGLFFATLFFIARAFRSGAREKLSAQATMCLIAASPPIVIWSMSGLENALTLSLSAALFAVVVRAPKVWPLRAGALVGLTFATHPGGLALALFAPLYACVELARRKPVRSILIEQLQFGAGLASVALPLTLFRLVMFARPLPHTYYAKRAHASFGDALSALVKDPAAALHKLGDLCGGALGPPGPLLVALTFATAGALAWHRRLSRPSEVSILLLAPALLGYAFIDADWMGEHRFGTAAVLLIAVSLASVSADAFAIKQPAFKFVDKVFYGILIASSCVFGLSRTAAFGASPTVPFSDVERSFASKLDTYAAVIGAERGSVLLPDVGAMLLGSRLTVLDAAGLCEPSVVRTLKQDGPAWLDHHPAFYDLIFDELRPTFISTHHFWTLVTAFDQDPRFGRDYVAINAYEDEYVARVFGRSLRSGDFVRRDALPDATALERMRAAHRPPPREEPLAARVLELFWPAPSATHPSDLHAAGEEALSRGDGQRAVTLFSRVLERSPDHPGARLGRARALDQAVRPDEARADWERLLKITPKGSAAHTRATIRLAGRPLLTPRP